MASTTHPRGPPRKRTQDFTTDVAEPSPEYLVLGGDFCFLTLFTAERRALEEGRG